MTSARGRVMALDIGDVRIGVAVSDPLRLFARPLTTIDRRRVADVGRTIDGLADEWEVARLVVGHPLLPSGDRGEQARAVEAFVASELRAVRLPVDLWDESHSTTAAAARRKERGVRGTADEAAIDAEAAAVILEEWLTARRAADEEPTGTDGDVDGERPARA